MTDIRGRHNKNMVAKCDGAMGMVIFLTTVEGVDICE